MNANPQFGRLGDGRDGYRFPFKRDASRVGRMDAGDDLHQCAFARAVFSNDRNDLARVEDGIDVVERVHPREVFVDSGCL